MRYPTPFLSPRLVAGFALSAVAALVTACAGTVAPSATPSTAADHAELAAQVEIRRTTYGVPQIKGENLRAAAFALAYVQLEDHGARIIDGLQTARGRQALVHGRNRVDADARNRLRHRRAAAAYHLLAEDTREVYEGFATGVNHFIRSNAWALAPSRTASGNAILLRNPHLSWSAGYCEAHLRVPGKLDFYGDFRIGGPFTVIGGFNPHLGFSTTNNESRSQG